MSRRDGSSGRLPGKEMWSISSDVRQRCRDGKEGGRARKSFHSTSPVASSSTVKNGSVTCNELTQLMRPAATSSSVAIAQVESIMHLRLSDCA